jgi:hypothetical protein
MEHILHSNIMSHFEKHAILTEAQHGFRSRRSCESQLIYTVHELTKGLSEGKQIDGHLPIVWYLSSCDRFLVDVG